MLTNKPDDLENIEIWIRFLDSMIMKKYSNGPKEEISYPDSFIMVRLARPSNFKFPGLISLSVFLRKLGLFSLI